MKSLNLSKEGFHCRHDRGHHTRKLVEADTRDCGIFAIQEVTRNMTYQSCGDHIFRLALYSFVANILQPSVPCAFKHTECMDGYNPSIKRFKPTVKLAIIGYVTRLSFFPDQMIKGDYYKLSVLNKLSLSLR